MTRKSYFLEYFGLDYIIRILEQIRVRKHDLFVRFGPIIYLHCIQYSQVIASSSVYGRMMRRLDSTWGSMGIGQRCNSVNLSRGSSMERGEYSH
jgi:hypothetical protein